jgi:hypothetical protein
VLSVPLAVLAAIANALASVLQRKAARERPESESHNWRLVWSLLHRPIWFGGVAAIIAGFLLQAVALGNGQLSVCSRFSSWSCRPLSCWRRWSSAATSVSGSGRHRWR